MWDQAACVSFHASVPNTAIMSCISPRALTAGSIRKLRHVHQRCLGHNRVPIGRVAAHHNRIGIQRLRQLERTRARRLESLRQSQVIQRIHAVGAARGQEPAEAKRVLRISAAASRIHSRLGWPVRLSKGSTSSTRPAPAEEFAGPLASVASAGVWPRAPMAKNTYGHTRRVATAVSRRIPRHRHEIPENTTGKL